MAQQGWYPDPPSRRMAWDLDGTQLFTYLPGSGVTTQVTTQSTLNNMNDENNGASTFSRPYSGSGTELQLVMYFPEKRDLTHLFMSYGFHKDYDNGNGSLYGIDVSPDSTNPQNGNWTNISYTQNSVTSAYTSSPTGGLVNPNWRTDMSSFAAPGTKAIRMRVYLSDGGYTGNGLYIYAWHIYGAFSAGQTPHRIDFCDSSGSAVPIDFDYGDQPRNTTRIWSPANAYNQTTALYLRNHSTEKVANNVIVSLNALTFTDMATNMSLSKDNVTFGPTVSYASMQPGEIVGPVYVKYATSSSTTLGVKASRLVISVDSWT